MGFRIVTDSASDMPQETAEKLGVTVMPIHFKPVITINEGVVEVISRARGGRKANQMLVDFIRRTGGIDDTMPCCLGFTGFSDETLTEYIDNYAAEFKDRLSGLTVVPVGATVGTYAGPGAVAIAFFNK